eukprot:3559510-Pyramimonas_sp.AAC.1
MGMNSQKRARLKKRDRTHKGRIPYDILMRAMPDKATRKYRFCLCFTFLPVCRDFRLYAELQGPRCMARSANAVLHM